MIVKINYDPLQLPFRCPCGTVKFKSWIFHTWGDGVETLKGFRFFGVTVRYEFEKKEETCNG